MIDRIFEHRQAGKRKGFWPKSREAIELACSSPQQPKDSSLRSWSSLAFSSQELVSFTLLTHIYTLDGPHNYIHSICIGLCSSSRLPRWTKTQIIQPSLSWNRHLNWWIKVHEKATPRLGSREKKTIINLQLPNGNYSFSLFVWNHVRLNAGFGSEWNINHGLKSLLATPNYWVHTIDNRRLL